MTVATAEIIERNRDAIRAVVNKYGCSNPRVFGSLARGEATESSDIDFIIDAGETTSLFDLSGIHYELAQLLKTRVDLVTSRQIPPEMKKEVFETVIPI
jgi:predicted nucleotidyltransferase